MGEHERGIEAATIAISESREYWEAAERAIAAYLRERTDLVEREAFRDWLGWRSRYESEEFRSGLLADFDAEFGG